MTKKLSRIALVVVVISLMAFGVSFSAAFAWDSMETIDPWQSGNAESETSQINCEADYAYKIDDWDEGDIDGTYTDEDTGNTFTISNTFEDEDDEVLYFDWESDWPVYCVIVVGGNSANVFYYPEGSYNDTGLFAPTNPNTDDPYAISHVTFGYSEPETFIEWICETAWAAGARYVNRGNWATYVQYEGEEKSVELLAAQIMEAGGVTFSAPDGGLVTITIDLNEGWKFKDTEMINGEEVPYTENIKIQGYNDTVPNKNPAPGQFDYKFTADDDGFWTGEVPEYDYYGVHVDVCYAVEVEAPPEEDGGNDE